MDKQELGKAIENGESVWCVEKVTETITEIKLYKDWFRIAKHPQAENVYYLINMIGTDFYIIEKLYKTKAEAEHYLHHANISRTEHLLFLNWEEFLEEKELFFTNKSGYPMCLTIVNTKSGKKIGLGGANGYFDLDKTWDLTEENFYKAYDECVRLFKGKE